MRLKEKEKDIERAILEWLEWNGIFAWKVENSGTYDPKTKGYRVFHGRVKGIPDILAIFKCRPLAIEVKSATGKLSAHQEEFLRRFNEEGGIAFMARSVDDVATRLNMDVRLGVKSSKRIGRMQP